MSDERIPTGVIVDNPSIHDLLEQAELRGFMRAIEMLRSEEAKKMNYDRTYFPGDFVSNSQWAEWLEARKP